MAGISTYLANKLLDHVLKGTTYTPPSTLYMALYLSNPGDDDSGTEVSGGGYQRQAITFAPASNRISVSNVDVEFPEATSDWGLVAYFGLKDAQVGGNLLFYGEVTPPTQVLAGHQIIFRAGDVSVEAV